MRKIRIPRFPISQPLLFLSPSLFLPSSASNGTRFTAPPPHPIQRGPRWIARTAFPPPFENRKKSPLRNLFFPGGFDESPPFSTTGPQSMKFEPPLLLIQKPLATITNVPAINFDVRYSCQGGRGRKRGSSRAGNEPVLSRKKARRDETRPSRSRLVS